MPPVPPAPPLPGSRYFTYPHNNGFLRDGRVVYNLARDGATALIARDLETGAEEEIVEVENDHGHLWFDIARDRDRIVWCDREGVSGIDLDAPAPRARRFVRPPAGCAPCGIASISPDGALIIGAFREAEPSAVHGAVVRNVETGEAPREGRWPWFANHFHFCPHDPDWIGFCHEGATETIPDRVWAWHPEAAPEGVCLFDQLPDGNGVRLCVGHERWCWHDTSALAVGYGVSPHGPRGIWQLWPPGAGRPPRLVSEGDRDWHVDVSRDGRLIVLDTTGPHDAPGRGWENHNNVCDVILVDAATGARRFLARSRLGPSHAHAHPVFSPDGRRVVYNECVEDVDGRQGRMDIRWFRLSD